MIFRSVASLRMQDFDPGVFPSSFPRVQANGAYHCALPLLSATQRDVV